MCVGIGHIQENLEDELVQEALKKGLDLRQYSREIESELCKVELHSVQDCIFGRGWDLVKRNGVYLRKWMGLSCESGA